MPIPGFYGRTDELAWLRGLWDACTARDPVTGRFTGGPRAAFVIAESGIGKSRLVQALYQQLTIDPAWDPPEVNYWPDAFQVPGDELRVNPEPGDHTPKGPPRFLWLGMRWKDQGERNLDDRTCRIPEARDALRAHVQIADRHRSAWQHALSTATRAVRADAVGEAAGQAADAAASNIGVPFGGLILKLVKGVVKIRSDRTIGERQLLREQERHLKNAADELLSELREVFGGPGSAGRVLPTVLWLDDSQWIDPTTLRFVFTLWGEAQRRNWPLLLVATHWEHAWRELAKRGDEGSLHGMRGKPGVEVRVLGPSGADAMDPYLRLRLPGLTPPQRQLMLEKAGGNFLTLVENVSELLVEPMWFEGERTDAALTGAGVAHIRGFKAMRDERVRQRFQGFAADVKKVLGWSSRLGTRFLANVIAEFARERLPQAQPDRLLAQCVDPHVVLAQPGLLTREFRDRAFFQTASDYREQFLRSDSTRLDQLFRAQLVEWVNNSFDRDGNEILPGAAGEINALDGSVLGLPNEELRNLLEMAVEHLPLGSDLSETSCLAAFRARYLLVIVDSRGKLWHRVRDVCRDLEACNWTSLEPHPVSLLALERLGEHAETAGSYSLALAIYQHLSRIARAAMVEESPQNMRMHNINLDRVGGIQCALGDIGGALATYEESLGIARQAVADQWSPRTRRNLSIAILRVAEIDCATGRRERALAGFQESMQLLRDLSEEVVSQEILHALGVALTDLAEFEQLAGNQVSAFAKCSEALGLFRRLAEESRSPATLNDLSVALDRVADLEHKRGDLASALVKYRESLGITRELVEEEGTPRHLRSLTVSLDNVASIEQDIGDQAIALAKFRESLATRRRINEDCQTPESLRDVYYSLNNVARIEEIHGDLDGAMAKYAEALDIARHMTQRLGTPQSLRDVSIGLDHVAGIERARGDLDGALKKFDESLQIRRKLAAQAATTVSLRDVSISLFNVARIEQSLGNVAEALSMYRESLAIDRRLAEELGTPRNRRSVGMTLSRIGRIEEARGDLAGAMAMYQQSLEICREICAQSCTPAAVNELVWNSQLAARVELALADQSAAIARLDSVIDVAGSLESSADCNHLDTAAAYWERRTEALDALQRLPEAAESRARAAAIRARIAEMRG